MSGIIKNSNAISSHSISRRKNCIGIILIREHNKKMIQLNKRVSLLEPFKFSESI